jgi:hypothetical protein
LNEENMSLSNKEQKNLPIPAPTPDKKISFDKIDRRRFLRFAAIITLTAAVGATAVPAERDGTTKVFTVKNKDGISPYDDIPKPKPWKMGDSLSQQITKVQRYTVGGREWERIFFKTYEWDGNDWIENKELRNMLDYPLMTEEESIELGKRITDSLRKQEEDLPSIYRDIPAPVDPPKEGEPIIREVGKIVPTKMPDGRSAETTVIRYFRWDEESYRWIETARTLLTTPLMTEEEKWAVSGQR